MVDIETLDTEPTAAVLSIGAVLFDPDGNGVIDAPFHQNITFESALEHGTYSDDTVEWWMKQDEDAIAALNTPTPVHLQAALLDFTKWIRQMKPKQIWANSPSFDLIILRNACNVCEVKWPLPHWVEMDVRTLKGILPKDRQKMFKGTYHNPVDDATNQVSIVQSFYQWVKALS